MMFVHHSRTVVAKMGKKRVKYSRVILSKATRYEGHIPTLDKGRERETEREILLHIGGKDKQRRYWGSSSAASTLLSKGIRNSEIISTSFMEEIRTHHL